jgi:predicted nucleotidyltransferase
VSLLATASSVLNQLEREGISGCLAGGLAVSAYCDPRFTLDVDLAIAIRDDAEIESVVHALSRIGLRPDALVEQESVGRLAIARLIDGDGVSIDLLVASSGIEHEIVEAAQVIEVVRGINMRVASVGHLIAVKLLSVSPERATDAADLRSLALVASDAEWERALDAVRLIEHRGFSRRRNLVDDLQALRNRS